MQLDHVTLAVRDLERSVRFYRDAIGLDLDAHEGDTAGLGLAGHQRLVLVERPHAAPQGDTAGLFHVAWRLASRAHLGAALARLGQAGIPLTGAADHHVSEAVYLDDPDGHGIELYADRPAATWRVHGSLVMTNERLDLPDLARAADAAGLAADLGTHGATLGHLHLEATDLAAARHFARTELALELQADWPNAAFFGWDGYHHHLAYNDWHHRSRPLDPTEDRIGLVGIALKADQGPRRTLTDPNGIPFDLA